MKPRHEFSESKCRMSKAPSTASFVTTNAQRQRSRA
jgi:hypothetical protein